jgi:hypothetical protein
MMVGWWATLTQHGALRVDPIDREWQSSGAPIVRPFFVAPLQRFFSFFM